MRYELSCIILMGSNFIMHSYSQDFLIRLEVIVGPCKALKSPHGLASVCIYRW